MWSANAGWPTDAEVAKVAARKLSFAVFNSDSGPWAAKIKAQDPDIKLYAYVCLCSVREYEPSIAIAGSVAYNDAAANNWLALDTAGNRIPWGAYGGHYQTTVWDTAYQYAYIAHIRSVLEQPLWDGIWADNDFWTLSYYSSALLSGTTTQAQTDQKLRDALDVLVAKAGAVAKSYGKIFMPNYGDGKLDPARQARHASYGGGSTEEMFCNWPHDTPIDPATGFPYPMKGDDTWLTEVTNIRDTQVDGAHTAMQAGDTRTGLYGYTSFLLTAQPGDGWSSMPTDHTNSIQPWQSFQDIAIGYPRGPYTTQGSVYTRMFDTAFIAVNPTASSQQVTLPNGDTQQLNQKTGLLISL